MPLNYDSCEIHIQHLNNGYWEVRFHFKSSKHKLERIGHSDSLSSYNEAKDWINAELNYYWSEVK